MATASYLPETVVTNDDIITDNKLPFKSNAIIKTVGVEKRHVAADNQDDSDLLCISAQGCLDKLKIKPENLTRIIVNKYMGDNLLPMTASRLQGKLGSSVANHAFDLDGGMSSFLYALDTAARFIATGDDLILIASGGVHYRLTSRTDPRVAFLFGDASAAIVVGPADEAHVLAGYFYTNHQFYELATARGMNFLRSTGFDGDRSRFYDTYTMDNWKLAEDFYRTATRTVWRNLQEESGLTIDEIDLVLVTENNGAIRDLTLETLEVGEEKSISLLRRCGNTISAMLPLLLEEGWRTDRIQKGMNLLLIAHGEGISGGGIIYKV